MQKVTQLFFHALIDSSTHCCLQVCQTAGAKETLLLLTISLQSTLLDFTVVLL